MCAARASLLLVVIHIPFFYWPDGCHFLFFFLKNIALRIFFYILFHKFYLSNFLPEFTFGHLYCSHKVNLVALLFFSATHKAIKITSVINLIIHKVIYMI